MTVYYTHSATLHVSSKFKKHLLLHFDEYSQNKNFF